MRLLSYPYWKPFSLSSSVCFTEYRIWLTFQPAKKVSIIFFFFSVNSIAKGDMRVMRHGPPHRVTMRFMTHEPLQKDTMRLMTHELLQRDVMRLMIYGPPQRMTWPWTATKGHNRNDELRIHYEGWHNPRTTTERDTTMMTHGPPQRVTWKWWPTDHHKGWHENHDPRTTTKGNMKMMTLGPLKGHNVQPTTTTDVAWEWWPPDHHKGWREDDDL